MATENKENTIPLRDQVYEYDADHIAALDVAKPWKTDPKFFKKVRVNVLAATKMVKHAIQGVAAGRAKNGLPIEIMGLLVGKVKNDTVIVMDAVELPVEGTEARVVADDEKVFGYMTRMQERVEARRKDRFIGWYHSHPFEVRKDSNCFFSATDVSTQLLWQNTFVKWVGIVVDPLRSLAKQKVELMSFMAYRPEENGLENETPDGTINPNHEENVQRWGQNWNRYRALKTSFFMGSLVRHNLEMMSKKHLWIRQLSSTAILEPENRDELPTRILTMSKKSGSEGLGGFGRRGGRRGGGDGDKGDSNDAEDVSKDIAIEQVIGHTGQIVKSAVFNPFLGRS